MAGLRSILLLCVSMTAFAGTIGAAAAQAVAPGFNATQLAANDDGSSGAVTLPFPVNFFGTSYSQLYVNNNGNVTFGSALSQFTPVGLGAAYRGVPIIAPFFADIDTRDAASGLTAYGTGAYAGTTAFGVTWPAVGYFGSHADRTNTFQLILASRSDQGTGNFDIYFNYNRIQFETGDASGGANGVGGTSAAAGYSAGTGVDGSYYQLPGSLVNGAFLDGGPNALATGSNGGVPGQFLFPVRNGVVVFARVCSAGDNASTTTTANCGPNQNYNGIFYTPTGAFTLNVLDNTAITAASGMDAVLVMPATTDGAGSQNNVAINVTGSATIRSADRAGIELDGASGSGAGTITSAGAITAATAGILAQTGRGTLTVSNTGTITAPFGILGSGSRAIIDNGGSITGATVGIAAVAPASGITNRGTIEFGLAGIAALSPSAGSLTIANAGTITQNTALPSTLPSTLIAALPSVAAQINTAIAMVPGGTAIPSGIAALTQGGATAVSNAGSITTGAGAIGIAAIGSGATSGSTSVTNAGTITAGVAGLFVSNSSGTATANGSGSGSGPITIANSGTVTAAAGPAVMAVTNGGSLSVTNSGTLTGPTAVAAGIMGNAPGASLTVTNLAAGRIIGGAGYAVDTSQSVVASLIDNRGAMAGALSLGSGSTFSNSGQFLTGGASDFRGGAILNSGTFALASGTNTGTATATLGGVATFTNAGTIDLRTGSAANTLTIGGNYVGSSGNLLLQASTRTGASDRLIITGNASGSTSVSVANLTPTTAFATSPVLIQVGGTVAPNAFTLGSLQNFGTLAPVLVNGTNASGSTVSLAAIPTAVGLSGKAAVLAARTIAFQGATAVLDRMTQLRESTQRAASGAPPSIPQAMQYAETTEYAALISKDPIARNIVQVAPPIETSARLAVWARAFGDLERRTGSTSFSFAGTGFTRDLGYSQATGGFLSGTDVVLSGLTSKDDGLIVGVMGGYTLAEVRLNQGGGRQDFAGGTVGTYATYLNGPAFIDALFKVDLLGLDITTPGLRQTTGLQNYNVSTNVGYRFPLEHSLYVEPTAGLEYVNTQFDKRATLTATTIPLQNGDALRGRIGARVGTEMIQDNIRIEPSITGYIYSVLTESRPTGAVNGLTSVTGLRDEGKARGEIQASVNIFDLETGISGFVRADYRVGADLLAGGGRAGIRYQW
ncbi:autotransporter outer membrane beta-barrel domain-containing protein [uncultured Methylobacterium sp.]|uniref:autotransporter outer membrane beta-barrel domain-containing protein n=1 Tax=uncultured Methylobacterium sp. TaxID=157278 RepID=UPI0035CA8D93